MEIPQAAKSQYNEIPSPQCKMQATATDNQDVLFSDLVNDGTFSVSIFSRRTWGTQQLK